MGEAQNRPIQAPPELVGPDYNLYRYRHDFYKVVHFKSTVRHGHTASRTKEDGFLHTDKLPQALARARKVCLELALCNEWKWFCTFTIASSNFDRKNLDGFYSRFSEWLKYQKKKSGKKIPYLLVPEQHGDGSWHMHGFFNSDIDDFLVPFSDLKAAGENVPYKLVEKKYFNWPDYQKKFGFCSLGEIRNHDATAFYATKYISKSFQGDAQRVGLKLYYCSQGLNRSEHFDSVYGPCPWLDKHCQNEYEWCSTGFVKFDRELGDDPLLDILEMQHTSLFPMAPAPLEEKDFPDVVDYYEITQEVIDGWN